jgi:hypothetical protein
MKTHELKTDPEVFQDVRDGRKTFEIRFDDRDYNVGDELLLKETTATGSAIRMGLAPLQYTGRKERRTVSHLLRGPLYGLADGWVILSFAMNANIAKAERDVLSACSGFIGAMEISRRAIKTIKDALRQGMAHSRKHLEKLLPQLEAELKQCRLDHQGPVHINSNVRLFDLVRYQRGALHEAELISDAEYSWLCSSAELATSPEGGSPSRERLEDYDTMRARLAALEK